MITSIFNNSKVINFVSVFIITVLAFLTARTNLVSETFSTVFVLNQLFAFLLCALTILLFSFIVSKNNLAKSNNFEILLFSLFLLLLEQTTSHTNILISNFFVLLGIRRIISLRSQKSIKSKLFDAALWVGVASLFYFWAILFFIVIIMSLFFYADNNVRHWVIPFVGSATIFSIAVATSVILHDDYFEIFNASRRISYDFSRYNSTTYIVAITMLISFGIWSSLFYLQNIKKQKRDLRASFKIVIVAALVSFVVVLFAPDKNGSEFLFFFAPLAIIITNYIQTIQDKWFKEIFFLILLVMPFLLLML
ncbi:DUF6427 family protein [Mariniflexile sp.]|uniref:DUF6427 family protein n=1 Tax=Mariniflexile sp. TaxID=1979402 RepID=UPI0035618623